MSRYCAWCRCYLGSVGAQAGVTHGICHSCAAKHVGEYIECRMAPHGREGEYLCRDQTNGQK